MLLVVCYIKSSPGLSQFFIILLKFSSIYLSIYKLQERLSLSVMRGITAFDSFPASNVSYMIAGYTKLTFLHFPGARADSWKEHRDCCVE